MATRLKHIFVRGCCAGAAGTAVLNAVTYADIALSGRQPSTVPAEVVRRIAKLLGWRSLSKQPEPPAASSANEDEASQRRQARQTALGALLGYKTGIGLGVCYAALAPLFAPLPLPLAMRGLMLGAAAMAVADVPATRLGLTHPADRMPLDWLRDMLPHAAYGMVAAYVYELSSHHHCTHATCGKKPCVCTNI